MSEIPIICETHKPESFKNFENAVKKLLAVSKEEVERREKEAKEIKNKSGKKRHSF